MLYRTSVADPWHLGMYTDPDPRIRTSDKRIRIREAQNNTNPDAESLKYSESLWKILMINPNNEKERLETDECKEFREI